MEPIILAEKFIFAEKEDSEEGLGAFMRFGMADEEVNQFEFYLGSGFTYTGLIPYRDEDVFGAAIAVGFNGKNFINAQKEAGIGVEKSEINLEFTYLMNITPWLGVQPSIQYVIDPSTDPEIDDAVVLAIRGTLTF